MRNYSICARVRVFLKYWSTLEYKESLDFTWETAFCEYMYSQNRLEVEYSGVQKTPRFYGELTKHLGMHWCDGGFD